MNRIRDLREDRDMRQTDLAEAVGIDQRTLSNYETGKTNPDSASLIKIADFFGVSTDYLLGRTVFSESEASKLISKIEKIERELSELKAILK